MDTDMASLSGLLKIQKLTMTGLENHEQKIIMVCTQMLGVYLWILLRLSCK